MGDYLFAGVLRVALVDIAFICGIWNANPTIVYYHIQRTTWKRAVWYMVGLFAATSAYKKPPSLADFTLDFQ